MKMKKRRTGSLKKISLQKRPLMSWKEGRGKERNAPFLIFQDQISLVLRYTNPLTESPSHRSTIQPLAYSRAGCDPN